MIARLFARKVLSVAALVAAMAAVALVQQNAAVAQAPPSPEQLTADARKVADAFTAKFHANIKDILKDGPVAALEFYIDKTSAAMTDATEGTAFDISLIAESPRATEHAPDAWEKTALAAILAKRAPGADASKLEHFETATTGEGKKIFRYMRPLVATQDCMGCHGKSQSDEMKSELKSAYPDDKSVGVNVGDILGAISMVQPLD
jgi:hypothetical protein